MLRANKNVSKVFTLAMLDTLSGLQSSCHFKIVGKKWVILKSRNYIKYDLLAQVLKYSRYSCYLKKIPLKAIKQLVWRLIDKVKNIHIEWYAITVHNHCAFCHQLILGCFRQFCPQERKNVGPDLVGFCSRKCFQNTFALIIFQYRSGKVLITLQSLGNSFWLVVLALY